MAGYRRRHYHGASASIRTCRHRRRQPRLKTVAGLTMVQSLFATGSGAIVHRKFQYLSRPLVLWMGSGATIASLAGAVFSRNMSSDVLEGIFSVLALAGAALMLLPYTEAEEGPTARSVDFNRALALACALAIGLVGGMVGQSGAFIVIPVMLYVLKIPTRTAIGSSLGVVFLAALAGSIGKLPRTSSITPWRSFAWSARWLGLNWEGCSRSTHAAGG